MPKNNNQPITLYGKQYLGILQTVFAVKAGFSAALAPLQVLDGVSHNKKAFTVKTNGTPVVIGDYKTGKNDVFGDGSGADNRFGKLTEVIYDDLEVDYDYTLAIREGIDRYTVNNGLEAAIAERFKLQSEAQVRKASKRIGAFINTVAGKTIALADLTEPSILKVFNGVAAYYTDNEVDAPVTAYVRQEVANAIVDFAGTTAAKGSSVSVDENGVVRYKGFTIKPEPKGYFAGGAVINFVPNGIILPFIGVNTARTIESIAFDGVELQAAARGGQYVSDDNKLAIVKVTGTIV